ncbi:MAG: hypothetical protein M5U19_11070 [Microthrixaceae bacterium]|nr:hypothetical protein [Microthrixaceae bacterium]
MTGAWRSSTLHRTWVSGRARTSAWRRFLGDPEDGEWVFVVPHDVEVGVATLEAMLAAVLQVPAAGLCCGDVGDGMVPVFDPYFGGMVVPGGQEAGWEPVDYAHGTLIGLRRHCLEEVGLFDERFFSYCEEADLALRVRRRGWQVGLVRGAPVRNRNLGSTVWTVDYLQTRNTLLLVQEESGPYHAFIRICFTLAQVLRGTVSPGSRPPVFDARARLTGVRDFICGASVHRHLGEVDLRLEVPGQLAPGDGRDVLGGLL